MAQRRAEFLAGRECARVALQRLGAADTGVTANANGSPRWPEGFVGSISHSSGFCVAIAGNAEDYVSLGVDAQHFRDVRPDLWPLIMTRSELEWLPSQGSRSESFAAVLFSAKEAFYKCQFAVTTNWLDFLDVTVCVQPGGHDCGTLVPASVGGALENVGKFAGAYAFDDDLVISVFWLKG